MTYIYQRALIEDDGVTGRVTTDVLTHLAIGNDRAALDSLREFAEGTTRLGMTTDLYKSNVFNDPILDQPEFVEVRSRLGFRE